MNQAELEQISSDAATVFTGLQFGKVFPLGTYAAAIDFFPHSGEYLYVDIDPRVRACYLITRRLKDLERSSTHASPFVISIRKLLSGRTVRNIRTMAGDKVIVMEFEPSDDPELSLVIQLGGKRPNFFVVDGQGLIVESSRESTDEGQITGEKYIPPKPAGSISEPVRATDERSLSEVLDAEYRDVTAKADLERAASAARKKINAEITKQRKLIRNLEGDLAAQGDADQWKRFGDLILANVANIRREDGNLIVTDYFDPEQREIAIPVEINVSPTEAAELFFKRYAKARNGAAEIANRLAAVHAEIEKLEKRKASIEDAIESGDVDHLSSLLPASKQQVHEPKRKEKVEDLKGVRRFISSDGMEIMVGKKAPDNDRLTFRIAKSFDLWLHAADYPGSHVVVRNPTKKEVPNRTLTEAAEVAAFYSDAREQPKAAVRYTQKKFVNKPRRAAPGLVSLSSFKTILVQPQVAVKLKGD